MKKFQNLSIKTKFTLLLGATSLLVMIIICAMLIYSLRGNELENSLKQAELSTVISGQQLMATVNSTIDIPRSWAYRVTDVISSDAISRGAKRDYLVKIIQEAVLSDNRISNLWYIFEPNVIDGLDSISLNKMGSNSQGRFAAFLSQIDGVVPIENQKSDLFTQVRVSRGEIITEPYVSQINGSMIISVCIPVFLKDKFIGVMGSDIRTANLYRMKSEFDSNVTGRLISNSGVYVIYKDQSQIGKQAEGGSHEIMSKIKEGNDFYLRYAVDGEDVYKIFHSVVMLGDEAHPWFYAIDIASDDIFASANLLTKRLILFCTLAVALLSIVSWLMLKIMLKDISFINNIINKLSLGHIHFDLAMANDTEINSNDELIKMKAELSLLVGGLKNTAEFAKNIGQGNLDSQYATLSNDDVLGNSLLDMRKSLRQANEEQTLRKKEEEQRNWGTAGLAKFAEILRSDNDNIEALTYNIISNMVNYLGANQGGIFVMNDAEKASERVLEMTACYAYDRKKFLEKKIAPGEGLVGTCFLEGKPIYMTKVPEVYISITSGLGDATPKAIFICPLKVNDDIYGVIELAAFTPFEPYQLEFIQKVSESIASTISSVRVNIRTSRLLEQTKLQAEEMANAEEELRQTMEEMQATQEEMRRREAELHANMERMKELQVVSEDKEYEMHQFQNAIFETCNVVEFSHDAIIVDTNKNLLNLFGAPDKTAFVGKHLSSFVPKDAYAMAWSDLEHGKLYEDVQTVTTAFGSFLFRQKFMPICNKTGELLKVLLLVFPENNK